MLTNVISEITSSFSGEYAHVGLPGLQLVDEKKSL
jgi:hypothetical protein